MQELQIILPFQRLFHIIRHMLGARGDMQDRINQQSGSRLTIDLGAVISNYRLIQKKVTRATVGAVVKADAYGLGASRITAALAEVGCMHFFVAQLCEARAVIETAGHQSRVYVLNGLAQGEEKQCAELGAVPVLNSIDQIRRWNEHGQTLARKLSGVIQFDTGMRRLGLSADDLDAMTSQSADLAFIDVVLVMSHLACADDADAEANETQRRLFTHYAARFPDAPRSLSNSAGAFLGAPFHNELVRAGIALYGAPAQNGTPNPMASVVTLTADIIQVRTVSHGQGVGYGLTGHVDHARRIAAIPVGYADGWPRRLGNRGCAFLAGVKVPIVGRISMDSMLLDVSAVPEFSARPGAPVELLGPCQSLADVAGDAETIPYEILSQLGSRYARHYLAPAPATSATATVP
jgi:alanine racemase